MQLPACPVRGVGFITAALGAIGAETTSPTEGRHMGLFGGGKAKAAAAASAAESGAKIDELKWELSQKDLATAARAEEAARNLRRLEQQLSDARREATTAKRELSEQEDRIRGLSKELKAAHESEESLRAKLEARNAQLAKARAQARSSSRPSSGSGFTDVEIAAESGDRLSEQIQREVDARIARHKARLSKNINSLRNARELGAAVLGALDASDLAAGRGRHKREQIKRLLHFLRAQLQVYPRKHPSRSDQYIRRREK